MSQYRNLDAGASGQLDAIPMQKAKPGMIAAIAGGVVLVVGALVWASASGSEEKEAAAQLQAKVAQSTKKGGLSAKEQREHLQMTQRALANFEAAKKQKQAEQAKAAPARAPEPVAAAPAPRPAVHRQAPVAKAAPKPKPKNTARAKKQLDSLDSIGDSITSALK